MNPVARSDLVTEQRRQRACRSTQVIATGRAIVDEQAMVA
jgi:hypothetical protein